MTYLVMARKYRPRVFADLIGQDHVVRTLRNAITQNRLSHAFIFSGPRGVGKTSCARILAKAVNCEGTTSPEPCNECRSCREINEGRSLDVIEIDGASNRGIDEIRQIRDNVKFAPTASRFKVYIIDEVHMLTEHAFNALLKTLEEPPAHVKFILATTAPDKVPVTIQSRCICFGFRLLTREEIVDHLKRQLAGEGRTMPHRVLEDVARAAEGSLRDSLSLLEQVVAFGGDEPGEDAAREVLHLVRGDTLMAFLDGIGAGDAAAVLRVVDELSQQGHDMRRFLQELIEWLRGMLLLSISSGLSDLIPLALEERSLLATLASRFGRGRLQALIEAAMEGERELRLAVSPRYAMEMVALRMLCAADIQAVDALLGRLEELESRLGRPAAAVPAVSTPVTRSVAPSPPPRPVKADPVGEPAEPAPVTPPPASLELTPDDSPPPGPAGRTGDWKAFLERLRKRRPTLCTYIEHGRQVDQDVHSVTVGFTSGSSLFMEMSQKGDGQAILNEVAAQVFGPGIRVRLRLLDEVETPAAAKAATDLDRKKKSEAKHNPLVREVLDVIGGKVIDVKVLNTLREGEEPSP